MKRFCGVLLLVGVVGVFVFLGYQRNEISIFAGGEKPKIGDVVDQFNGVKIYYNGAVGNSVGRQRADDGYNFGQGFQCVEFVKRYYYEKLNHRMPDTWGHARDFFNPGIPDGGFNAARGLLQFRNGEGGKPQVEDLLVYGPSLFNSYGHVAIVSKVSDDQIEIAQQNPGPRGASRMTLPLLKEGNVWRLSNERVLGWLRKP